MKIFGDIGATNVVAIGIFDGVHLGHQQIIATAVKTKGDHKLPKVVALTFDPHPTAILAPEKEPLQLTTVEDRVQLLQSSGADAVAVIKFDQDFANLTSTEFIENVLIEKLAAGEVVVGENFTFGNKAAGRAKDLAALLPTHVVPLVESGGDVISSTRIRNLLIAGDVTQAQLLLGRRFTLCGEVIHGEARGRTIGYPTANLKAAPNICIPADGVYAGWLSIPGNRWPAAISIGTNPTFPGEHGRQVEAYVLDRDDLELYGEIATYEFGLRLRETIAFDGLDPLLIQMAQDCEQARNFTASAAI
ncbi:MAG: bifunctional riboflavin kinase/FAD synthetase [Candidatus Nanopelagicaceae bacterium]|nr:bifunctional riboflavin kinase/FAD synthetase [Candidatus Nanopelagicaceae bacterium]